MALTLDALPRLRSAIAQVRPVDPVWRDRAIGRLDTLAKPPGSLGRLEWMAARLCAIQETLEPRSDPGRIVIFAADHGVAMDGVSAYPASVTAQMVGTFLRGGAAISALAAAGSSEVWVVDVGVAGPIDDAGTAAAFLSRRVREGTRNMTAGPAMSDADLTAAVDAGLEAAAAAAGDGIAVLACGDMGIGNTTAASAMTAAFTGRTVSQVTGRGTGIDDDGLIRKRAAVAAALRINEPGRDPLDILQTVGGLELAAIAAACIGAAAHRLAIVGDGFVTTAAVMASAALCPAVRDYWFAGHLSTEPGHRIQLEHLDQEPLLQLGMRLGEGTGAAVAMPLLRAAAAAMCGMATLEGAGVAGPSEPARQRHANR